MLSLLVTLVVIGFVVWLVLQIPMPAPFRNIVVGVVIFLLVIWILTHVLPMAHLGM